ncbi:MAG: GNAT family N-acetyltransferase [Chloroflexi bacterium]|nr:GNAT family N-acetyltransferase [Chloroflexota bacterium]
MAQARTTELSWHTFKDAPPRVRLRPAQPEEEGAVMALRRACGWSAESVPQQFRAMRDGRRTIYIAVGDGYLVGTITVEWVHEDRELADGVTCAHISNLVVHPAYRHRGIGRGLLAAVQRAAVRRGCRLMTIGVDHGNDYARRLYERLGYSFRKDVNAPWGAIHVLTRPLSDHAVA